MTFFRKDELKMKIEISKHSKEKLTDEDWIIFMELINMCVNTYCLISKNDKGTLFVIECVPKEYVEKIKKHLPPRYEVTVQEDSFMAEIDLMDILSGGLW